MNFLNKMTNGINGFMNGRYGLDAFGIVLIALSVLFVILGRFFFLFYIIGLGLLGFEIFRILSVNTAARERENGLITSLFQGKRTRKDDYIHFACPNCGQNLRIPVGLGKKVITCPRCEHRFVKRS